jgi:MoxR-like ATPase
MSPTSGGGSVTTTDENTPISPADAEGGTGRTPVFADRFAAITANIEKVIKGKPDVVHLLVLALVCDGHVLVEDVPGIGKTTLGKALARSVEGVFGRVQFTPDLLPADVTGTSVYNRANGSFEFRPGPVFSDVLLADEINRASPKTQSALLEAMGERQVTVDGITRDLGSPFIVIATQNPIEHEGTYPLPESQLDRFLMRITIGYPGRHAEEDILENRGDHEPVDDIGPVTSAEEVRRMSATLRSIHVAPALRSYLLDLADATRRHPALALGLSPRGTLALQRVCRAHAASAGRSYVTPDDVKALAPVVIPHRLLTNPETRMRGMEAGDVVTEILDGVPVPREAH